MLLFYQKESFVRKNWAEVCQKENQATNLFTKKPKRQAWKSLPFVAIVKRVLGDIEEEYWVSQH